MTQKELKNIKLKDLYGYRTEQYAKFQSKPFTNAGELAYKRFSMANKLLKRVESTFSAKEEVVLDLSKQTYSDIFENC